MKIETIYVLERKNLGNYEHIEMSATARLEDNEDPSTAMLKLKEAVHNALNDVHTIRPASEVKPAAEAPVVEKVEAEPVDKPKRGRKPKEEKKEEAPVEAAPQVEEVKPEPKKVSAIVYDSNIPEHKSIFGGYLAKKYGNAWKTMHPVEEIKAFTASLNGEEFIDANGHIVESFLELVHGFFGA